RSETRDDHILLFSSSFFTIAPRLPPIQLPGRGFRKLRQAGVQSNIAGRKGFFSSFWLFSLETRAIKRSTWVERRAA
ncbi:MAG: hypothetical protein P8X52_04690, partial [Limibacillus sp.]